jgi:multicomponent Na+:H+ antiporter subunit E
MQADRRTLGLIAAKRAVIFALVWLAITGADPGGVAAGAAVAAAATWLSLRLLPPRRRVALGAILRLAPGFLWRSLLGGVDVAARALSPRMPLKPGWTEVRSRLPPGPARAVVGGQFSLLPGTLVAGTRGDRLLIHALDVEQDIARDVAAAEAAMAMAMEGTVDETPRGDEERR